MSRRNFPAFLFLAVSIFGATVRMPGDAQTAATSHHPLKHGDDVAAAAASEAIIPVLHNPRCMNCHSKGDFPRQGNDSHRHSMQVRRGANGVGEGVVECSSCHQDHNLSGLHTPPGAPGWHLPSPSMPMIWEGLSDGQLCELFKDPHQNGGRSPQDIVDHMHTPLVLWGWRPGEGRLPVPLPQREFLAKIQEWASNGAACPGESAPRQGRGLPSAPGSVPAVVVVKK